MTKQPTPLKMLVSANITLWEGNLVQNLFATLSEKIMKKPVLTIFCAILVIIFFVAGVTQIRMATGNETFIKTDSDIYRDNLQMEETFGGENVVIHFKTEDLTKLFTVENVHRFDKLERLLLANENVYSVIGPATTVRHITEKQMGTMAPALPTNQDTLEMILYDDGNLRPMFAQMVINYHNAMLMVRLIGNAPDSQVEEVVALINHTLDNDPLQNTTVTVTGKPILDIALRTEMRSSMQKMVISALIFMIIIVSVVFRVRWRLFPLVVNFAAVVATMGLMSHLGIPMTMVSMAAFPILIGLGIDYSIQFHNRYEEEFMVEEANHNEI